MNAPPATPTIDHELNRRAIANGFRWSMSYPQRQGGKYHVSFSGMGRRALQAMQAYKGTLQADFRSESAALTHVATVLRKLLEM